VTQPGFLSCYSLTLDIDGRQGVAAILLDARHPGRTPPYVSNHNYCNSGDGCYYSGKVPYANQGFYGSAGSYHGNWPDRNAWYTGRYTAYACWTGACSSSWFGPNTYVTFGGSLVNGTVFGIN
jgi:hypothetical protein